MDSLSCNLAISTRLRGTGNLIRTSPQETLKVSVLCYTFSSRMDELWFAERTREMPREPGAAITLSLVFYT